LNDTINIPIFFISNINHNDLTEIRGDKKVIIADNFYGIPQRVNIKKYKFSELKDKYNVIVVGDDVESFDLNPEEYINESKDIDWDEKIY